MHGRKAHGTRSILLIKGKGMASNTSKQALQIAAQLAQTALIRYKKAQETAPTQAPTIAKKGRTLYTVKRGR